MEINARLQPHLGRPQDRYKPQLDMTTLAIAKVTKVHHKSGTVDLQLIKSNSTISSDPSNEGKFGARVLTTSAHFDPTVMASSGVVEPMQPGQLVLLAFIDGLKNQPVILGSFHQTWENEQNVLTDLYPLNPDDAMLDKREATKYLRVHPSQYYERVDGIGAKEVVHPSKTFLQVDPDLYGEITDEHGKYDHKDLNEKDPYSGQSRAGHTEETSYPVNVLFVHRSSFDDDLTTWTKLFIQKSGLFRLTRDNNDGTLSYVQLAEDGSTTIRRQVDSNITGEGENYTELGMGTDGTLSLNRVIDGKMSTIGLEENGDIVLTHKNGDYLKITDKGIVTSLATGGGGLMAVSATEPVDPPDGLLWIDTSDITG